MLRLLLASSSIIASVAAQNWIGQSYQGLHCRGTRVQDFSGPAIPFGKECRNIDQPGFTATMVLEVLPSAGHTYEFEFHEGPRCAGPVTGTGPIFLPPDGLHSCVRTNGAASFSIFQVPNARRDTSLAVRAPSDLQKRDNLNYMLNQGAVAIVGIAGVITACAGALTLGAPGAVACGFLAFASVLNLVVTGRNINGVFRGRTPPGNDPGRLAIDAPMSEDDEKLYNLLHGYTDEPVTIADQDGATMKTFRPSAPSFAARTSRDAFAIDVDVTFNDSGETQTAHYEHDFENGVTDVSSSALLEAQNPLGRRGMEKRIENVVFHYAFDSADEQAKATMPTDQGTIDRLVNQSWQWMRQNNRGNACAYLQLDGRSINRGYMYFGEGNFNDQRAACPVGG